MNTPETAFENIFTDVANNMLGIIYEIIHPGMVLLGPRAVVLLLKLFAICAVLVYYSHLP